MQYKVPQNINQEDKILGPLTFVQFIYVLIGGGIILLSFATFSLPVFFVVAIPIAIITAAFALLKIQDQPFSRFFIAFLLFLRQPKQRIWQPDHPDHSTGLGTDWLADVKAEEPKRQRPARPVKGAQPIAAETPLAASATTANQTAAVPAAVPTAPAKPARKLSVQVVKGGQP